MRTIIKPSEATPIGAVRFPREAIQKVEQMFTAAECAQIARAYYAAMTSDNGEPSKVADAWESLFNQWGSK